MLNKLVFFTLFFCFLIQSCDSSSPKQASVEGVGLKTDTVGNTNSSQKGSTTLLPCSDVLTRKGIDDIQKIYSDTMTFDQSKLLFVTRDSALSVFRQKDNNCVLLVKMLIDSTDLYAYRDGSPLLLMDLDGDNQKEVLVTVAKKGNHPNFRAYKMGKENGEIVLKKIRRFEELTNPKFDAATGLVRAHWSDKGDYELDEFYKISSDNALVFVKGFERSNGKELRYTTKASW